MSEKNSKMCDNRPEDERKGCGSPTVWDGGCVARIAAFLGAGVFLVLLSTEVNLGCYCLSVVACRGT